jgi:hypothetical protein
MVFDLLMAAITTQASGSANSVWQCSALGGLPITSNACLQGIGDVDSDGVEDLLIGYPGPSEVFAIEGSQDFGSGSVVVLSGSDGSVRYEVRPESDTAAFGSCAIGLGDVNGDSTPDFAVGAPPRLMASDVSSGAVYICSGADGAILRRIAAPGSENFGRTVAGLQDMDGDGVADLAVASSPAAGGSEVLVYSSLRGEVLYGVSGAEKEFGAAIAPAGDVNGNGTPDFAIGSPRVDAEGTRDCCMVCVYDGKRGELIFSLLGSGPFAELGAFIEVLENEDGPALLAVTADGTNKNSGAVVLVSLAERKEVWSYVGADEGFEVGMDLARLPDIDGDGMEEFAVCSARDGFGPPLPGRVRVIGSRSRGPLLDEEGMACAVLRSSSHAQECLLVSATWNMFLGGANGDGRLRAFELRQP